MTNLHDLVHQNPTIKGLRGHEGPNVMCFNLGPSPRTVALLVCYLTKQDSLFNQEERVVGLRSVLS